MGAGGGESGRRHTGGDDSPRRGGQWAAGGGISTANVRQRRGAGRGDHGQRRARGSVRRGRIVARARNAARLGDAAGHAGYPNGAAVRVARPSIGLPAEDQFLRWVECADVGELHTGPGGIRRQRHRVDSAAIRRCGRQSAFSASADGDDGGDVAAGAGVRPAMLDLVSGDGRGLLGRRDGGGGVEGMGRSFPQASADRRGVRARRRSGAHRAAIPDGAAGEADGEPQGNIIRRRRCGCLRKGSMRRGWSSFSD